MHAEARSPKEKDKEKEVLHKTAPHLAANKETHPDKTTVKEMKRAPHERANLREEKAAPRKSSTQPKRRKWAPYDRALPNRRKESSPYR